MSRTDDPSGSVARYRAMGMSDALIAQRLVLDGWDASAMHSLPVDIPSDTTPARAAAFVPAAPVAAALPVTLSRSRSWVAYVAIGLACSGVTAAAYMYLQPPPAYSISVSDGSAQGIDLEYGALPALSDPSYYGDVITELRRGGASFIDANLSTMKLVVYVHGTSTLEVPIMAKGKVGSWWETPAGVYKIQTKEENHLSSFGGVYMPYSMDFQGNFFIHGWPYYEDGTPVATSFSGGCIRLSTEDARKVFEHSQVGMPVVVYNEAPGHDGFSYQLKGPSVTAANYLVADLENHTVLMNRSASSTAAIASITKLVTALVATEYINLDKSISVSREALVYTSVPRLKAGQEYRAYDLLFLLLQESSNEAAEALARSIGRERFVSLMNEKVRAIGLERTLFSDPSGAKNDISNPEDLFTLLKYIYSNRQFVFSITAGTLADSAYGTPSFAGIANFNKLKNMPAEFVGGKIGQTNDAGETFAGVYKVKVGSEDRLIAVVLLGSRDAQADVSKLLAFVKSQYAAGAPIPIE